MTRLAASIECFYEVFPSHWLLLGSSISSDIQDVIVRTVENENISGSFCLFPSASISFAKSSDQDSLKEIEFVAFITLKPTAVISALLVNGQPITCSPEPLNTGFVQWTLQLQNVLKVLRVHDRSKIEIERLLHCGFFDFVQKGEQYWSTQQPWMKESFELIKIGCQCVSPKITLLYVCQSSDYHHLLNWLRCLCLQSWCVSGHVRVIIVAEQSCCPDIFITQLQKILELEQISLEVVVPSRIMTLSECINLGVWIADSEFVLADLSLCITCLTDLMTCLSGLSSLEPLRLIYPGLKTDLILRISPPMLFRRQSFFELGGILNLGVSTVSVSKQMIHSFSSDRHYGVRECLDNQVKGIASSIHLSTQEDVYSKSALDSAFESYILGG